MRLPKAVMVKTTTGGLCRWLPRSLRTTAAACASSANIETRCSFVEKFHHERIETQIMKLPRRQFLHMAAGAAALPAVPPVARARSYPTKPVRIIVGFAAGGPASTFARLVGQWLSERLGQGFIIENRPDAGTNIASCGPSRGLTQVGCIKTSLFDPAATHTWPGIVRM
jgi:hypothetical protein